jgi:hypothetical protein
VIDAAFIFIASGPVIVDDFGCSTLKIIVLFLIRCQSRTRPIDGGGGCEPVTVDSVDRSKFGLMPVTGDCCSAI